MTNEAESRKELERYAEILVRQADQLVHDLGVDVSDAQTYPSGSAAFRQAADAYEPLALTWRRTNQVTWERTKVDGRTGEDIMKRLWEVREDLRREDARRAR